MSSSVRRLPPHPTAAPRELLEPARVTEVRPRAVTVELSSGTCKEATLALAYPYEPAVGDTLLVIGDDRGRYVIGVIEGAGRLSMTFEGDVNLHSRGALTLSGDAGVTLRGPAVELRSARLRVIAEHAVQRFRSACTRVRELLSVHAGESRTVIVGDATQRARRTTMLSAESTTVDGETILIG